MVSENDMHSLVLASGYEVADVEAMWLLFKERRSGLASIGAHHVVLYTSIWEPGRVFVTVGIRHRQSVPELLRSRIIFDWFDLAGVENIPAIFAGEVVEKIDLYGPSPQDSGGVIVAAVASVDDVAVLVVNVHDACDRLKRAGFRKIWVYGAFDDPREVMILVEIDDETSARRWIDHPDSAAEWMSTAGIGAYPTLFVGKFAYIMSIEAAG